MEETIQEKISRYLDEIYNAETDEDVEEILGFLFNEGYIHGFSSALEERIENDIRTINYMRNLL